MRLPGMRLSPFVVALVACGGPPPVGPEHPGVDREGNVGKLGMRLDIAAIDAMLTTFYPPRAPDQVQALQIAREHHAILIRLAPYSLESTIGGFVHGLDRLGICVRPPLSKWPCLTDFKPKPAEPHPAYEITEPAPGVAQLAIHDLSNPDDPIWAGFAADAAVLAKAKAIVLDLRFASGTDPRPLLPWLEAVTGRTPLRPLLEIRRPEMADKYVDGSGRDRSVWSALVGTTPAAMQVPTRPIAIVVGRHCGAACELVARVLETYAEAFVLGGATVSARLYRDEPARLTLPTTGADVFFLATEYRLNSDIEARTGPTHQWTAISSDNPDADLTAAALREIQLRLAHPSGWPARCDAPPGYATHAAMPDAVRKKISSEYELDQRHCSDGQVRVELFADLPISTLRRFLATCAEPMQTTSYSPGRFTLSPKPTATVYRELSQLAQSELVRTIEIRCEHYSHID